MNTQERIPPTHPGEILRTELMEPLGLSQNELARQLHVDPRRVNEIVNERRAITADSALRLSALFGNSPDFWLGLQVQYELDVAEDKMQEVLKEVRPLERA